MASARQVVLRSKGVDGRYKESQQRFFVARDSRLRSSQLFTIRRNLWTLCGYTAIDVQYQYSGTSDSMPRDGSDIPGAVALPPE